MPIVNTNSSDLKPTFVAKPDMRFATSFLSTDYREHAVMGESIMDKATGEIFTKRKTDGRVMSFFQNKKYMHDTMLELRVLLNNNPQFTRPEVVDEDAYFMTTVHDFVAMNDEKHVNVAYDNDTVISNLTDTTRHQMRFNLANNTNGFFINVQSRDCDKPIINFLSTEYNVLIKNYTGTDANYIAEQNKFTSDDSWEDSNATIFFTATVFGKTTKTYTCSENIRVNETVCVDLPNEKIDKDYPNGYDRVEIQVEKITYDKIHFMTARKSSIGGIFLETFNKIIHGDDRININFATIYSFVNSSNEILLMGNEFIIGLLDMPYCNRYMAKMNKLLDMGDFITSEKRPEEGTFVVNGVWAEQVRDVYANGETFEKDCEVDIRALEAYLAGNLDVTAMNISQNEFETENIYFYNPYSNVYSNTEVDIKMKQLADYVDEKAENIVSMEMHDVADNGLVLDPVEIIEEEE